MAEQQKQQAEFSFGKTKLKVFSGEKQFKVLNNCPVNEPQQVLLDNLWNANSNKQKFDALCALNYYFSKGQKNMSKFFSWYALTKGPQVGLYSNYPSLMKVVGNSKTCSWIMLVGNSATMA